MKKSFFCEACGTEVKGRSDTCPSCGRSFLGVRCPRCGKEGSPEDFTRGGPDCGYMTEQKTAGRESGGTPRFNKRHDWPTSRYWTLSALIVIAVALILYFWIR